MTIEDKIEMYKEDLADLEEKLRVLYLKLNQTKDLNEQIKLKTQIEVIQKSISIIKRKIYELTD